MQKGKLTLSEVKFWGREAESCIERQKIELCKRNNYPLLINYYEGFEKVDHIYPHVSSEQKLAIINEYFPNTNALISEIMFQNPDILVDATKPQSEEKAPLMQSALKYFFTHSDALVENRIALFYMLYAGYAPIEVDQIALMQETQDIQETQIEEKPKSVFDRAYEAVQKVMNIDEVEKNVALMSPPMESNFSTVQGTYIRAYDPLDVPLDWRASRIKDRRYNLKKVWLSKAEFDAKYPDFKNQITVEEEKFDYSMHGLDLHNRKVLLYEFQVRMKANKFKTIIISPNFNMREIDCFERQYETNGFNMKIGTLHKYGKLYSISMAQVNKMMNDEMNNYVKHLMEVAERNVPKVVTDKNKVKGDAKTALRSTLINDIVEVDGNPQGAAIPLQNTMAAPENKELLGIFQDQKNKLWSVSESRISGKSTAEFATEMQIQEDSFQQSNIDIQEGLRLVIKEELDCAKDIIMTFWDGEVFLKVTGKDGVQWYEPQTIEDPFNQGKNIVANPLTDELLGDYEINIDIASASRPNRSQQLQKMTLFMQQLVSMRQILIDQGKDINIDEIRRISKEFGWNPDKIFVDHQPAMSPTVPTAMGEVISPEEDARRQAEAEARVGQGA